jgi:F-type H+-transporting ATPase subunit gamma
MKMVSAAKLKKAQDAILQIRPYAGKLAELLSSLSSALESSEGSLFTVQRAPDQFKPRFVWRIQFVHR